jgi:sec-independent protein translocase protein TatC
MRLLDHLEELRRRIIRVLWFFVPTFLFVMSFEVNVGRFAGLPLPVGLRFSPFSALATQVFRRMVQDLIPPFVEVVILTPAEALTVQFKVGMFITILLTMPVLAYQAWMFISPGLYHTERMTISRITFPATILFMAGAAFAYLFILPFGIAFLYGLGPPLGADRLFVRPDDFLDLTLITMAGMGVAFQTPLIMWALTRVGFVTPGQWKKWWRFAIVGFFIFGAIITPDGSGLTMVLVALPMSILYGVGIVLASGYTRRKSGLPGMSMRGKVAGVLALLLVLAGAGYYYYGYVRPTESKVPLGEMTSLDVTLPLLVLHSPDLPAPYLNFTVRYALRSGGANTFLWPKVAPNGKPLVFNLTEPSDALRPTSSGDGFTVPCGPVDGWTGTLTGPNRTVVLFCRWRMEYQVFEIARSAGNSPSSWIQVDFRATVLGSGLLDAPGVAVTRPAAQDLRPVASGDVAPTSAPWDYTLNASTLEGWNSTYGHGLFIGVLRLGQEDSNLLVQRRFQWGPADGLLLTLSGSQITELTVSWYWDTRFGTPWSSVVLAS